MILFVVVVAMNRNGDGGKPATKTTSQANKKHQVTTHIQPNDQTIDRKKKNKNTRWVHKQKNNKQISNALR